MHHRLKIFILLFLSLKGFKVQAIEPSNSSKVKNSSIVEIGQSPWEASLQISAESNFLPQDDASYESMSYWIMGVSYRRGPTAKFFAIFEVDQDLTKNRETALANTKIGVTRDAIALPHLIGFTPSFSLIAPTNEKANNEETFQGAGQLELTFSRPASIWSLPLITKYSLRGQKNAHEYTRDNLGNANLSHLLRHTVSLKSKLTQFVSIGLTGYYQTAWTYNDVFKSAFLFQQDLDFNINSKTTLSLYHRNNGNALEANGLGSNLSIYDEVTSYIGAGISISL